MLSHTDAFHHLRQAFDADPYPDLDRRKQQLQALRQALLAAQSELIQAAATDFGQRDASETRLLELLPSLNSINYSLKQIGRWLKPAKRHISWLFRPGKNFVVYQPLGVVGIIVPWNYPIFLSLGPLIAAISAGNKVMLKLSELTPRTNQVLKKLIETALPDCALVFEGDAAIAAQFSQLPFDHLLYTGSTAVGYKVMQAASANLTPVTLELGGKSPVLVAPDADIQLAAERIVFGKTANAGQTCVAPDYLLVHRSQLLAMSTALQQAFRRFYPTANGTGTVAAYTAVINQRHFGRLSQYLQQATELGAQVISCGDWPLDPQARLMPLQLVLAAPQHSDVWQQEIFGPVLPLQPYDDVAEALAFIRQQPRPLALYLFSNDHGLQQQVLQQSHAGGVCLNETLMHVGQDDLPFGGIGPSGMGHYHGKEGFLTFSHAKAVHQQGRFSSALLAYPQHRSKLFNRLMQFLLR